MSVQLPPLPALKDISSLFVAPIPMDAVGNNEELALLSPPRTEEALGYHNEPNNEDTESSEEEFEEESLLDKEKRRLEEEGRKAVLGAKPTESMEDK